MQSDPGLVYRGNFLLVQEYLAYLLQVKMKNPKSVERYRFSPTQLRGTTR